MRTLHLVSHTHWDREWYQPFQLFRLKLVRLVDDLLDLLEREPDYRHFMLDGQTVVLDDYLEIRPEREADLRRQVQAGRILIGPWHILPDEFLVSPEATIRNLLQGRRTSSRFGASMPVGYIPDSFGHIGQMPQILRGFGLESASLQRGVGDEPCELWWQAPDGSRVFVAYLRDGYGHGALLPVTQPESFLTEVQRVRDALIPHAAASHILVMHGTDHTRPAPETPAAIDYANEHLEQDRILHSTLPDYIDAARRELAAGEHSLPTLFGELRDNSRHHLLPGVLSARIWIKQRNHTCESLLEKWAEPFSTLASRLAPFSLEESSVSRLRGPEEVLRRAWRLLMECHPHDSICGTSIDQVHQEMQPRFDQVEQIGEEITEQSLLALAGAVNTCPPYPGEPAPHLALAVFNPLPWPVSGLTTAMLTVPEDGPGIEIVDAQGRSMPLEAGEATMREILFLVLNRDNLLRVLSSVQTGKMTGLGLLEGLAIQAVTFKQGDDSLTIQATLSTGGEPDAKVILEATQKIAEAMEDLAIQRFVVQAAVRSNPVRFLAENVPGLGCKTFWVRSATLPASPPAPDSYLENEYLRVAVDESDGTLTLTDKRSGLILRGLNLFVDSGDRGDEYNFCPPEADQVISPSVEDVQYEASPLGGSVTVRLRMDVPAELAPDRRGRSLESVPLHITTRLSLNARVPRLDVHTTVDNPARDHRLRVHFPVPIASTEADYDGHFEVVRRTLSVPPYDADWAEEPRPEKPQRLFTDVSDGERGLAVANRGLPEVEVIPGEGDHTEIALTLLRCVGWLAQDDLETRPGQAGPKLPTPGAQMIGSWDFDYSLIPHSGDWQQAYQQAHAFNVSPRAILTGLHEGALPPEAKFLKVSNPAFVVSAIKEAEDGSGLIVRGYNITGSPLEVTLIPGWEFSAAGRVNLDETPLLALAVETGGVTLDLRGHEVVTVKFV